MPDNASLSVRRKNADAAKRKAAISQGQSLSARKPGVVETLYDYLDYPVEAYHRAMGVDPRTAYQESKKLSGGIEGLVSPQSVERVVRGAGNTDDYINAGLMLAPFAAKPVARVLKAGAKAVAPNLVRAGERAIKYAARPSYLSDKAAVKAVREGRAADRALAQGVAPTTAAPAMAAPATAALANPSAKAYVDPSSNVISDWQWRPLADVQQDLGGLSAISPEAVEFGRFMQEKNLQAARGMNPRDLLKAYGITRASIQRQARPLATAERGGLELGQLGLDMVRPEGAFSEWLGTPAGQAYLDAAQRGQVRTDALEDLQTKFAPFGFQNKLADDLGWAAENLPQEASRMSDLLVATPSDAGSIANYRDFIRDKVRGVAAPKAGFVGSMLGRGDLPTFDARQIILNTGRPTEEATPYLSRRKGVGGVEAVDRLAARLSALGLTIPNDLAPYYQHLAHHTVWDKASNETTTHADLMNAMRNYYSGGAVSKGGN